MHGYEDLESLVAYWKTAQSILELYAENTDGPRYYLVNVVKEAIRKDEVADHVKTISVADTKMR